MPGMTQTPLPLMLPQDLRNMDMGYFVLFSHKTKGTVRGYAFDPEDLNRRAAAAAGDSARILPTLPSRASPHNVGSARSTPTSAAVSASMRPLSMITPMPVTLAPARVCSSVAAVTPVSMTATRT